MGVAAEPDADSTMEVGGWAGGHGGEGVVWDTRCCAGSGGCGGRQPTLSLVGAACALSRGQSGPAGS